MKSLFQFIFLLFLPILSYGQAPNASFGASLPISAGTINICHNQSVIFYNNSGNTIASTSYNWSFGAGAVPLNSAQFSNIQVTYSQVGNFMASLQVNNNNGQPVSIFSVNIHVLPNPTGSFTLQSQGNGFGSSTFNEIPVFKNCNAMDSTLFSFNLSATLGSSQVILWGDGTTSTLTNATSASHVFGIGQFNVQYLITSPNGCSSTYSFIVFNGSSPVVTVSGSGQNTCVPFPYPIDIISNDVPISYYISYSDNTAPLNFNTANDTTVSHVFNSSSCGQEYYFSSFLPPIPNAYSATIVAQNLCSNNGFPTVITIGPITISQGVEPIIEMNPVSPICLNESVNFHNASISGLNISSEGCDSTYHFFWSMEESQGYSLNSGEWGSGNGYAFASFDPNQWTNGTDDIELQFQSPGTYHLKLYVGSPCGLDSVIQEFEIKPLSSVTVNFLDQTICSGDTIVDIVFTSVVPDYNIYWEITDSQNASGWPQSQGMGASPLIIENWVLNNTASETGYVDISASVGCSVVPPTVHRVFVNPQGDVFVNPEVLNICNNTETSFQISSNLSDAQFSWVASFDASMIQGAADGAGEEIIQMLNNVGDDFDTVFYHIVMSNSVCPGIEANAIAIVQPDIFIDPISDLIICPGDQVASTNFTSNLTGVNYHWENDNNNVGLGNNGNGDIPNWTAQNNITDIISSQVLVLGSLNNCPADSITFSIDVHPVPTFDHVLNPSTGLGCASPVSILGSTNISNPNWTWTGPMIINGANSASPEVNQSGVYHVVVVDIISNCASEFDVSIEAPTQVQLNLVQKDDISCWGLNDGRIEVNGSGGSVQYQWSPNVSNNDAANNLAAGSYNIIAVNEDGCQDQITVDVIEPSILEVALIDSVTSQCGEGNGFFLIQATGGVPDYSVQWSNGSASWENVSIDAGNYSVVVSDANDCEKQLDFEMPCVQFPDIIPYQFISPNEDGKNDYWVLQNLEEYENAEVFIFNRWGSLVFHDDHYQNDWRGTCNKCSSDAEVLPSATYYYKVVTNKKSKSDFTGFIEIQP
jgi:gliding motility-associated-like protein